MTPKESSGKPMSLNKTSGEGSNFGFFRQGGQGGHRPCPPRQGGQTLRLDVGGVVESELSNIDGADVIASRV